MEDFLNHLNDTKKCYEAHKFEDLKSKNKAEIADLCLNQRIALQKILFSDKLSTTNVIKDRIALLDERNKELINQRRKFLDA